MQGQAVELAMLLTLPAAVALAVTAGPIVAALFLQHFAGEQPWAHLDIAGPSIAEKDKHEISAGATGFGVRLLLDALDQL